MRASVLTCVCVCSLFCVSQSGDVYDGSFLRWHRHGWGVQRWSTGEVFRGSWEMDAQACGVFTDARRVRWKGDFRTGAVVRLRDDEPDQQSPDTASEEATQTTTALESQEEKQDATVTHFPARYAEQHAAAAAQALLSQTQPLAGSQTARDLSSTQAATTQPFPVAPHSARAGGANSSPRRRGVVPRPRLVPFTRRRETRTERTEREAREALEVEMALKDLRGLGHTASRRFGSARLPGEATFGLMADSPGPAAYAPSLTQTRRVAPRITMASRLPYQTEVAQLVKASASPGPGNAVVPERDPTRPTAPSVSTSRPPLLPAHVTQSSFFHPELSEPGPGAYEPRRSARGSTLEIARSTGPTADLGGSTIKGHPIPRFPGSDAYMRSEALGRGADLGLYTPRVEFDSRRPSAPSFSMLARHKDYAALRAKHAIAPAPGPGPAAYSPNVDAVRPVAMAAATGFGRSKFGARPTVVESIRAVAYDGPNDQRRRAQLGLEGPGPAAYTLPSSFGPTASPRAPIHVAFGPHILQPPAVQVAATFLATNHPFVARFQKHRKQQMQQQGGGDGADDGGEAGEEAKDAAEDGEQ